MIVPSAFDVLQAESSRLACPWCRALGLVPSDPDGLRCPQCGRVTRIENGVWRAMGPAQRNRTLAQISNLVPLTARIYENLWRVRSLSLLSGRPFPIAEELAEMDAAVGDVAGDLVADIGCSEGLYARHLAARGATVLAVDHSVTFLMRTRQRAAAAGVAERVVPTQAMGQRLPVGEGGLDAAVIGGSLNEIGDRDSLARELARTLRPDGRLFVMSLTRARSRAGRALQAALAPSGIRFPTVEETTSLFSSAGFVGVETGQDRVVLRLAARRSL